MKIQYYKKNVYGNELFYLAAPEEALNFELILNQKTITKVQMALFQTLGIEFEQVLN